MNTLFLVALIVEGLFGIGFVIAPGAMMSQLGATLTDIAITLARLLGSALLSLALLLWFARKSDNPEFKKGTVYSLFAYYLVSTVVLFIAMTTGQANVLGWGIVGMHVIFLVWFGYYLVK